MTSLAVMCIATTLPRGGAVFRGSTFLSGFLVPLFSRSGESFMMASSGFPPFRSVEGTVDHHLFITRLWRMFRLLSATCCRFLVVFIYLLTPLSDLAPALPVPDCTKQKMGKITSVSFHPLPSLWFDLNMDLRRCHAYLRAMRDM